jgi:hypothetical protein
VTSLNSTPWGGKGLSPIWPISSLLTKEGDYSQLVMFWSSWFVYRRLDFGGNAGVNNPGLLLKVYSLLNLGDFAPQIGIVVNIVDYFSKGVDDCGVIPIS